MGTATLEAVRVEVVEISNTGEPDGEEAVAGAFIRAFKGNKSISDPESSTTAGGITCTPEPLGINV